MRPAHPCSYPTCPTLVVGRPRCPEHTVTREERNPRDPQQIQFYGSTRWKKIRAFIKHRDPICTMCHRRPTTNADHVDGDWQNNDPANLRGLCDTCDRRQTGVRHQQKAHKEGELDAIPAA